MLLGGIGVLFIGLTVAQFAQTSTLTPARVRDVSRTAWRSFPGFMSGWIYMIGACSFPWPSSRALAASSRACSPRTTSRCRGPGSRPGFVVRPRSCRSTSTSVASGDPGPAGDRVPRSAVIFVFAIYVIIKGGAEGNGWWPLTPVRPSTAGAVSERASSSPHDVSPVSRRLLGLSGGDEGRQAHHRRHRCWRPSAPSWSTSWSASTPVPSATGRTPPIPCGRPTSRPCSPWVAQYGGFIGRPSLKVSAIVDAIAVPVAVAVTRTRLLYALDRDGIMPR